MFFNQQHEGADVLILWSCIWRQCYACCEATSVPECAELKLSFSFSWLRFKLHLAVPDLKVAVVLMRGTLVISWPARQKNRTSYIILIHLMYQLNTRAAWDVPVSLFWIAERKDRCKSVMFCTCLSNASRCCSFVRQPGRTEAFHRSIRGRSAHVCCVSSASSDDGGSWQEAAGEREIFSRHLRSAQIELELNVCVVQWIKLFQCLISSTTAQKQAFSFLILVNESNQIVSL